jgi:hypothetical protein
MSAHINAYQELTSRIAEFVERDTLQGLPTDGSRESLESLSESDLRLWAARTVTWIRYGDLAFYQYEMGMLSEERFESAVTPLSIQVCTEGMRLYWAQVRIGFVQSYREYLDGLIAEC